MKYLYVFLLQCRAALPGYIAFCIVYADIFLLHRLA